MYKSVKVIARDGCELSIEVEVEGLVISPNCLDDFKRELEELIDKYRL